MVDRLPSPPSTFASTSGAGGLGGSVQSCFSDSESDASGSSKEGLDDSSSLHTVKSGAVVRVVKRSPSSLQRIETFLSAKGRSLSRGLSRQPSASGRSSSISSKGGMMMMMNASTGAGQSRTNNNPLATSTSSTGGPILPPPSPGTTRGAAATTIAATTVAAAAAVVTTAAPPSPRASAPLPLPPQQQPPSPGRSQQQQQQVGSAPPPSLAATTGGGSSTASLSGLAASVGGLLLGRSLAEEAPEGLRQQGSVSVLASSTGKPSVAPSASPRQQSLGLGLGLGEEEKGGSGKASSSSYGSGGGIGGDGDLAASLLALGGGLMDAGFAFLVRGYGYAFGNSYIYAGASLYYVCERWMCPTRISLLTDTFPPPPKKQQSPKTPTPEEQKALQLLARRLVVKPTADAEGDAPAAGFDLTAEPRRALLLDGLLDKIGACGGFVRSASRVSDLGVLCPVALTPKTPTLPTPLLNQARRPASSAPTAGASSSSQTCS